jgi:alkyl sulfatase BDS1-like metallo-beta-lactamase superfamily hydrolase
VPAALHATAAKAADADLVDAIGGFRRVLESAERAQADGHVDVVVHALLVRGHVLTVARVGGTEVLEAPRFAAVL